MSDQYQEKVNRILATVAHKESDHVPVLANLETWAISHAGKTVRDIEENPQLEAEIYSKPYELIYTDALLTAGLAFDAKSADIIGSEMHFVSEDGQTVQHREIVPMRDDEYEELIRNPIEYTFNTMLPRKAKRLQHYPESYNAVQELVEHWKIKSAVQGSLKETLKTVYHVPILWGNLLYPPMDFIFDYYRGFKGISIDMRRRPELLEQAIEALFPYAMAVMGIAPDTKSLPKFPFFATMMHVPTFLSPKQFERFFWPTYEKMFRTVANLGGKTVANLEGNWESKYDFINQMPKNFAVCMMEEDDIFEAKKRIGKNVAITGGMPLSLLKYSTKQECIDYAKKVVDECAPGGGFMFSTNYGLLSKGDINLDNLITVYDFVHNYR